MLLERLIDGDHEDRLDILVGHFALAGPQRTFLQARLAARRSDTDQARALIRTCLKALPGHPEFRAFAAEIGV